MLRGISSLFSPELLATLYRMGHGDEIVFADAHFPGHSVNDLVIRADGLQIEALLGAVLPLFALDSYVDDPVVMMDCVPGDSPDPAVAAGYRAVVDVHAPSTPPIRFIERYDFYERARSAFAVVMTGDTRKYANIILKKGVS
ncbi:MAG: L-fucose mutarotase [Candidatus Promineifilaceae bacterium]|jgi:L-fucose mutarotase